MAFFLKVTLAVLLLNKSAWADSETEGQTPAWTKEEMYRDLFPLDRSNFSHSMLQSREAWIVLFHKGTLERAWKALAVSLRGIIWFGLVNVEEEATLLKEIRYYEKANGSQAVVYPHGPGKASRWEATSDPETAKVMATDSLPDLTLDIRTMGMEDFVVDCLMATPSRFPTLLLTEEDEVSPLWRALAYRFQRHFQFGRLARPTLADVRQLGLSRVPESLPHLLVLTTTAPGGSSPDFKGVPFQQQQQQQQPQQQPGSQGGRPLPAYTDVFQFLYVVNRDYRHLLFGNNMADRQEEVEMKQVLEVESKRFDLLGVTGGAGARRGKEARGEDEGEGEGASSQKEEERGPTFEATADSDHDEL